MSLLRRQPYSVIVLLATMIYLIALDPERVLLVVAVGYVVSGPLERLVSRIGSPGGDKSAQAVADSHEDHP